MKKEKDCFSERLKHERKLKGITQNELCEGINKHLIKHKEKPILRTSITMYETGKRKPRYNVLMGISVVLGVSMDFLMGTSDKRGEIHEC